MSLNKLKISSVESAHMCARYLKRTWRYLRNKLTIILLRAKGCSIDWSAFVDPEAAIEPSGGVIIIGPNTRIDKGVIIRGMGGRVTIGANCSINAYSFLSGSGGIEISDFVMIASHVSIYASNHIFTDVTNPMTTQGLSMKGIRIHQDVWVGTGARIVDGVEVGQGCVIGAGAVVTKSTLPYTINAGVPARSIGNRLTVVKP